MFVEWNKCDSDIIIKTLSIDEIALVFLGANLKQSGVKFHPKGRFGRVLLEVIGKIFFDEWCLASVDWSNKCYLYLFHYC